MEEKYPIIDVHSHVIPGIDDGARTMEEACGLLSLAAENGITSAIATPHCSAHRQSGEIRNVLEKLKVRISDQLPDFRLYAGNEVFYFEELPERLKDKKVWTLAESSYVLVEFGPEVPYSYLFRGIRRIVNSGYIPILAHIERYACLHIKQNLEDLEGSGCLFQMNFDSLQGHWYQADVRWCREQVLEHRISLLATDMHRLDFRPPDIRRAMVWLKAHVDPEDLKKMLYENPMKIIENNTNS